MTGASVKVIATGPLFDARANIYLEAFKRQAVDTAAAQAMSNVLFTQQTDFQKPTGAYWSKMTNRHRPIRNGYAREVTNPVIYAPWLEGTGSRNKTTRFEGYGNFRRATQTLVREQLPRILSLVAHATIGKLR